MQTREKNGRFGRTKRFIRFIRNMFLIVALLTLVGAIWADKVWFTWDYLQSEEYVTPKELIKEVRAEELTPDIVERMKKDVIEKLKRAESHGHTITAGEVFYSNDPTSKQREKCLKVGGKRPIDCDSWGPLQMKIPTVRGWYKELYGKEITEVEALNIALDYTKASELAIDAITKIEGAIWAWTEANNEREFYEYIIPLIREYEK